RSRAAGQLSVGLLLLHRVPQRPDQHHQGLQGYRHVDHPVRALRAVPMPYQSNPVSLLDQVAMVELRGPGESAAVSLEARLIEAFAGSAVDSARQVDGVRRLLDSPDITHPEKLAVLQEQL